MLLGAGRPIDQQLLVVSELVRQQSIPHHADSRRIPDRIVSLCQLHIRLIVRGKARCNLKYGSMISISVTSDGFTFLDRLSYDPPSKEKTSRFKQWPIAAGTVTTQK